MIYILENETMKIKVSSMGAELQSIRNKETDTEYLWQGDPDFWAGRAANVFPICGRLIDGKYSFDGIEYEMGCHGFARHQEWEVIHQKATSLTLQLQANETTCAQYPFRFAMEIAYTLTDKALSVAMIVHNLDEKTMYFALGGHPGFNLPMEKDKVFEDYFIEFDQPCEPRLLELSDTCFYTGETTPYPLEEGRILPLKHSLFDRDALFFKDAARGLTLRCTDGERSVHMAFPDLTYVGLWHSPRKEAPFVCIEPWSGVPSLDIPGVVRLQDKPEMTALEPEGTYRNSYTMSFN